MSLRGSRRGPLSQVPCRDDANVPSGWRPTGAPASPAAAAASGLAAARAETELSCSTLAGNGELQPQSDVRAIGASTRLMACDRSLSRMARLAPHRCSRLAIERIDRMYRSDVR